MIPHKQLSLADVFTDCQNKFDNDKYQFLSLLDETINLDEIVPVSFVSHFHASTGRPRKHQLYPMLKALLLQRIFSIPTDSLLLVFLLYSQELRDFCGFDAVPDASMFLFDTSGIEAWVTENNPKYANRIIKQLKAFEKAKKLLEDIPNKVRDILGLIVDVNLYSEEGKDYLEIVVNPNPYPVNYYGEYHYRTGSTKQLLKGQALNQFLMQKTGIREAVFNAIAHKFYGALIPIQISTDPDPIIL